MTREEAICHIKDIICENNTIKPNIVIFEQEKEALYMAIKALEQEPCEDCISRRAVLDQTYLWSKDEFLRVTNPFDYLRKRINDLPLVTPARPKGKWISETFTTSINPVPKCPFCNKRARQFSNFCPNCGAKMIEPQERSGEDADSN